MIRIGEYHNEYQERIRCLKALASVTKINFDGHRSCPEWHTYLNIGQEFEAYDFLVAQIKNYKVDAEDPYKIYFLNELKKSLVPFIVEKEYEKIEKLALCSKVIRHFPSDIFNNPTSLHDVYQKINAYESEILKTNESMKKFKENDLEVLKIIAASEFGSFSDEQYKIIIKQLEEKGSLVDGVLNDEFKAQPQLINFFSEFKVYEKVSTDILDIIKGIKEIWKDND